MENKFRIGDCIVNTVLGNSVFAKVVEIRFDGLLIVENSRLGRWIADPTKCNKKGGMG